MEKLLQNIRIQEQIANQLEIPREERLKLLNKVSNLTNDFIDDLPIAKSFILKTIDKNKISITNTKHELNDLLSVLQTEMLESGIRAASGGHVGYIPGGGIYASALADYIAAVSNEYAGVSYASPGAVAIENEVLNWLKGVFSFPRSAAGNLASGGSISNLIALTAARDKHQVKNEKITKSVIYLSSYAHHCIKKSLRIIGLEDVQIRELKLDDHFKIDVEDLKMKINADKVAGLTPFLVIASAGTTDVGAIDPLDEIATIAHENKLWFHVDAAYGGFFILTSRKNLFKGIERADSLVVDPHKGLFLPYGLGAVLVKDQKAMLHSNLYTANYMQDSVVDELINDPANVSPELTKHFRGLRLWLPLQLHGIEPFIATLEEKLLLTEYFRVKLQELGFCVGPQPDLSVSYFWFPTQVDQNAFNKRLMQLIHDDGSVFLSSTMINDRFVIRIAILSFRTKQTTIDRALEMITRCLEITQAEFNV